MSESGHRYPTNEDLIKAAKARWKSAAGEYAEVLGCDITEIRAAIAGMCSREEARARARSAYDARLKAPAPKPQPPRQRGGGIER